jgi:L-lactate dehydrogenase complex protein LldG
VTVDARDEVIARIRTALRDRPAAPDVPRTYRTADHPDGRTIDERLDLLTERLEDYRAAVRRCPADDLPTVLAGALGDRGAHRVVVPAGLPSSWLDGTTDVEFVPDDPPLTHAELDVLDGVVTACAVAVAETGTIVLDAGPGQGRRAVSLVPDYHLVVVLADQVVGSVPAAVARLVPTRPLTWISGPSATSDIELDRVEGVHGPRNLEVILVDAR